MNDSLLSKVERFLEEQAPSGAPSCHDCSDLFAAGYLDSFRAIELVELVERHRGRPIPPFLITRANLASLQEILALATGAQEE